MMRFSFVVAGSSFQNIGRFWRLPFETHHIFGKSIDNSLSRSVQPKREGGGHGDGGLFCAVGRATHSVTQPLPGLFERGVPPFYVLRLIFGRFRRNLSSPIESLISAHKRRADDASDRFKWNDQCGLRKRLKNRTSLRQ